MDTTVKVKGHTESVLMLAPLAETDREMPPVQTMVATSVSRVVPVLRTDLPPMMVIAWRDPIAHAMIQMTMYISLQDPKSRSIVKTVLALMDGG